MIQLSALLFASLQSGAANPVSAVDEALRLYWNGEYEQAVVTLSSACTEELAVGQRLQCYQYLAFSHVALGDDPSAEREFMGMLAIDPGYRLDDALFSPKILARFDAARERLAKDLYSQGKEAYFAERFDEALGVLEKTLLIEPENELALEYRDLARERLALSEAEVEAQPTEDGEVASADEAKTPAGPEPDANGVYRPTSEIRRPVVVERTPPRYPVDDRRRGIAGSVVLSVVIGDDGRVGEPKVIRSVSPSIDRAAIEAVRTWRYRPALLRGAPVPVYGIVTVNFEYQGR